MKPHAQAPRASRRIRRGAAALTAVLALAACGTVLAACGTVAASGDGGQPAAGPPAHTALPPAQPPSSRPALPSSHPALPGSVPLGTGPALCAGLSQLRRLTVTRIVTLRNNLHFPFPARVTVTDPARVRAAATAACRLPELPRGTLNCPADFGISYRLAFAAPGRPYPALTAAATGCAKVTGLGLTRSAVPSFWVTLGKAMNLASPGAAAFAGQPR